MQYDRLITGVAAVFAVLTGMLTIVGLLVNPAVLFLALMFGASTYFMYYHASGKLAAGIYERVERRGARQARGARRGGFDAGPREEWTAPRDGRTPRDVAREARRRARQQSRRRDQRERRQRGRQPVQTSGPSTAEAYRRLGLDPDADQGAVKRAYREKVKEVHPDTDSGTEAEFKRVKAAYERLTDD